MKIILAFLLLGLIYNYRKSIMKIIAAIVLVLLVFMFGGETLIAIVITLGVWAAFFGFFALVTSYPKAPETTEDKILKELEKLNRKNGR